MASADLSPSSCSSVIRLSSTRILTPFFACLAVSIEEFDRRRQPPRTIGRCTRRPPMTPQYCCTYSMIWCQRATYPKQCDSRRLHKLEMKSNQKHSHYTVESFQLTVALLGRFLPRLGPFPKVERPLFFENSTAHAPRRGHCRPAPGHSLSAVFGRDMAQNQLIATATDERHRQG